LLTPWDDQAVSFSKFAESFANHNEDVSKFAETLPD